MKAFIILTINILFHLESSIICSFPLNDANLETQWDNISIRDLQSSFSNKNDDTMNTISKLNKRFVDILKSYEDLPRIIENSYESSQLPTTDIDLGTKNLWVLEQGVAASYMKYYMTLDCQLKWICKFEVDGMQIQSILTLSTPIQTNGTTTRAYLGIPIYVILNKMYVGAINVEYNYNKQLHVYPESEAKNLQIDENKLKSMILALRHKFMKTFDKIISFSEKYYYGVEIYNNSSEIASKFQPPNLYIIPDPKVINNTDNIHEPPQCIVENVKKDIGGITNSNFIVVIEGLSNFSSAEIQGNYTAYDYMQLKTEVKTEKPLRGKLLWEFSSKQNSNNYSVKVDFTIDHLYIKTEMRNAFDFSSAEFDLQVNVDVGKLQFKTSVVDVIENEKFSQCLRSIIARSVSNSSKEAIKSQLV